MIAWKIVQEKNRESIFPILFRNLVGNETIIPDKYIKTYPINKIIEDNENGLFCFNNYKSAKKFMKHFGKFLNNCIIIKVIGYSISKHQLCRGFSDLCLMFKNSEYKPEKYYDLDDNVVLFEKIKVLN